MQSALLLSALLLRGLNRTVLTEQPHQLAMPCELGEGTCVQQRACSV